jgi:hypothetical protein
MFKSQGGCIVSEAAKVTASAFPMRVEQSPSGVAASRGCQFFLERHGHDILIIHFESGQRFDTDEEAMASVEP